MSPREPLSWIPEDAPFLFPDRLKDHFRANPSPYSLGLSEFRGFPVSYRVWRIERGPDVVGFAWIDNRSKESFEDGRQAGWYLGGATFREFERQGVFRFAMDQLEREAAGLSADAVLVQVNSNEPDAGGRVRKALTARGYSLLRSDEDMYARDPAFRDSDDAGIVEDWAMAIVMKKTL